MKNKNRILSLFAFALPFILTSCSGGSTSSQEAISSSSSQNQSSSESTSEKTSSSFSDESSSGDSSFPSSEKSDSSGQSSVSSSQESSEETPCDVFLESDISKQTYLHFIGDIAGAWDSYRGSGVTLAVIDRGFDLNHPEFKREDGSSKILSSSCNFSFSNGTVRKQIGASNCGVENGDAHGTICACVAAGSLTGTGIAGIAPDADLMLLKTDGKPHSIAEAFKYAADNGAKVISVSIGSYADYEGDLVKESVDLRTFFDESTTYAYNKGVVICSAAGNGGGWRPTEKTYPGASMHVIGCGGVAYNEDSQIWSGSSYNGSEGVFCDIFAPSDEIYSGLILNGQSTYQGGMDGTSFAAPQVAGAACLYFEKNPDATPAQFEADLSRTAFPMNEPSKTGYGRLNVGGLLGLPHSSGMKKPNIVIPSWWKADGASSYIYCWNESTGNFNADFPGVKFTDSTLIDYGAYDFAIVSRRSIDGAEDWNARSINIHLSMLEHVSSFNLSNASTWYSESGPCSGTFIPKK